MTVLSGQKENAGHFLHVTARAMGQRVTGHLLEASGRQRISNRGAASSPAKLPRMAKRVEPCRKSPEERLDDLLSGHREAALRNEGEKYLRRAIASSDSMPNAVKFFAYALLAADAADDDDALEALARAEAALPVAREDLGRRFEKELPDLAFLERGVAARSGRAEFEEAARLCDLALSLGLGAAYERKKASLLRMI